MFVILKVINEKMCYKCSSVSFQAYYVGTYVTGFVKMCTICTIMVVSRTPK